MSIEKIIDWRIAAADGDITGTVASSFYQYYDDSNNWVWACDVDIGEEEVLRNVPIASNNREILYAEEGKSVALKKTNGKYVVAGLAKTSQGFGHVIYVTFADDVAVVVSEDWSGYSYRPLTYGELGTVTPGGYGTLPYGSRGKFTRAGILIEIMR